MELKANRCSFFCGGAASFQFHIPGHHFKPPLSARLTHSTPAKVEGGLVWEGRGRQPNCPRRGPGKLSKIFAESLVSPSNLTRTKTWQGSEFRRVES